MKFEEYYKHYLSLHQNKWNRRLHVVGQILTISYFLFVIYLTCNFSFFYIFLMIFLPFIVYPFAWTGHYLFEKNKPAAFKNPWLAKKADWVMFKDIILGKIKI